MRRLFDAAAAEGSVALPLLSATELWMLCGGRLVLAEEIEARWWKGLSPQRRATQAAAIADLLTFRKLLSPPAETPAGLEGREMTPGLALIVAAVQRPALTAVAGLGHGPAAGAPRMYGLADQDRGLRALVAEYIDPRINDVSRRRLGRLHHFALLSPPKAASVLATWALPESTPSLGRRGRTIDVDRGPGRESRAPDRITVTRTRRHAAMTRQRPALAASPAVPCDRSSLAAVVEEMLTLDQP